MELGAKTNPHDAAAEATVLDILRRLFVDLHGDDRAGIVTLDASLERELGFDSLARVELLVRIRRAFAVDLPEELLARAGSGRELVAALRQAPRRTMADRPPAAVPASPAQGEWSGEPARAGTLVEVLQWHVARQPDRVHAVYLADDRERPITYRDLARAAGRVAAGLQRRGLEPRQAVAIMMPTCPEYFQVYMGILLAGGIPVPIYPPARLAQLEEHVRRHVGILNNARAALLVTMAEARPLARLLRAQVPTLGAVVGPRDLIGAEGKAEREPAATATLVPLVPISPEDVAFIQYTSGSTGDPKGVVLTHANLLANIRAMIRAAGVRPDDVFVSWLPLYHDMGLIGAWLGTLYLGIPLVVMSPLSFLASPARWLWAIHRHRGTLSAAPNFAYELCARKLADDELAGLDLGSWRLAFNGAEAVLPETVERFCRRFAAFGFRAGALTPVYGLAECSVGLAFPPPGRGPLIERIRREPFMRSGRAEPANADDANPLRFVGCGHPLPGHELRVVDAAGIELGERVEGQLEFRGPSATRGYLDNPGATARLFRDGWLDTGDRAYIAGGEVFVTGRVKDIIIRGGRNIHPHEVEEAAGEVPGVRKGCVVAFGSPEPASGSERLVVVAETRLFEPAARERLRAAINAAVAAALGEPADLVELAPPHAVPKTSSGKLRRAASRELFEAGRMGGAGAIAGAGRWQLARVMLGALLPQLRRWRGHAAAALFAAHAWCLFGLLAPVAWLLTALTPRPAWAWAVGRVCARLLIRLSGTPFSVRGLERLPRQPCVLVANHGSYVDGIALAAALPGDFGFVAKRELESGFIARVYLRRLGAQFVERFTAQESVRDAQRLEAVVRSGRSLVFFPEGTFTRMPGLRPFHMGAFVVAAATGVPVVPVAIRGTRSVLRDDQWWPRRGPVGVTVGAPLWPPVGASDTFAAALALRDAARAEIGRYCGEPARDMPPADQRP